MNHPEKERLRKRRYVLENPYAHIEQLLDDRFVESAAADLVASDRRRLQDPYAHLDGNGEFSALTPYLYAPEKRLTQRDIEQAVTSLQRRLWKEKANLWTDSAPLSAVDVLDPAKAAELLGYRLSYHDSLGLYIDRRQRTAVAGILDQNAKEIRISREFPVEVQRFTAAHEVGHVLLHPHIEVLHRDRALDGASQVYDHIEREANKFAAFFLLPEKLVRGEFYARFLTQAFELNEATSFALGRRQVKNSTVTRRATCRTLATTIQYNGKFFRSLSEVFGVSPGAMAIRLEELALVS